MKEIKVQDAIGKFSVIRKAYIISAEDIHIFLRLGKETIFV